MAFTEAQLAAELVAPERITMFAKDSTGNYTDVAVMNMYSTARKAGLVQCAQSLTASQAAAAIRAALT